MDVKIGHCWRCEKRIAKEILCSSCGVAKYCVERCRLRDQYRHKPECEEWGPKTCSNQNCNAFGQLLKQCSACNNAWYCGETCQRQHWKIHKGSCQNLTLEMKAAGENLRNYFQKHSIAPFSFPYYFGNTLAIDMLNLLENEYRSKDFESDPMKSDYSILSAGCGNLRNWIVTVASLPKGFTGKLHTVLNDLDPFMQARNVLHLYMMIMYPDEEDIADTITTLWYSLHLTEKDYKFLVECLTALHGLTASALGEVTGGIIQLTEADMSLMQDVWQGWLNLECRKGYPNFIDLHKQRQQDFKKSPGRAVGVSIYRQAIPSEFVQSYDDYDQSGDFIQGDHADGQNRDLEYDNPTLTGYKFPAPANRGYGFTKFEAVTFSAESPKDVKFVYCIPDNLFPFGTWDYLKVKKHHFNKSMTVMFHRYISDQIKQVMKRLKERQLTTSIIICNCLELPQVVTESHRYDRIFTSNIADFSGTQSLLRAFKPLLNRKNKCATIVTRYWNWFYMINSAASPGDKPLQDATPDNLLDDCMKAAVKDVNSDVPDTTFDNSLFMTTEMSKAYIMGPDFIREYYNYTIWFVSYLRAELLAFSESSGESKSIRVPTFQMVKQSQGLRLRDFRRGELNKVAPFCYRKNARPVNLTRGMARTLEWYYP